LVVAVRDAAGGQPGLVGGPALAAAGGRAQEVGPAHRSAELHAGGLDKGAEAGLVGVIVGALGRPERHLEAHHLVLGEVVARQLGDLFAVDHRADQGHQRVFSAVGALERGGQAELKGRHRAAGGGEGDRRGQVVDLVPHDEAEAVAVAADVQGHRVVGRDGHRPQLVLAPAEQADLEAIKRAGPALLGASEPAAAAAAMLTALAGVSALDR
jgi:hypothetical protein